MSVLGKRKRKDIDIESKEEKEEFSASPPKKRLKSLHITDRKRTDDKQENDMDVDTEQKSMEIVDIKPHDQSINTSSSTSKDHICSFSMDAVINNEFKTITDTDLKGAWSIIYFYPHNFEKVSSQHLKTLNDKISGFEALNSKVIAVSTESKYASLAWINELGENFKIPIASDLSLNVCKTLGVSQSAYRVFIISPSGFIENEVQFPSAFPSQTMVDQLLVTIKSLQNQT